MNPKISLKLRFVITPPYLNVSIWAILLYHKKNRYASVFTKLLKFLRLFIFYLITG